MPHATATVLCLDQQLTAVFETITPEIAERYLGKNVGNRSFKSRKVAAYARDIMAGEFLVTGEAIKFDWNGRLIDGQNRLAAIISAERPVVTLVVRGLDPKSQQVLDTGAKRSHGDALKIHGASTGSLYSLGAAIRLIISYREGVLATAHSHAREVTHAETLAFYDDHQDLLDVSMALASKWAKKLYSTPGALAASVFLTMGVDAVDSHRFFQTTADMEGFAGRDDPRAVLLKRLESLRTESPLPAQFIYFTLRAWNEWRAGRTVTSMKDRVRGGSSRIPEPK